MPNKITPEDQVRIAKDADAGRPVSFDNGAPGPTEFNTAKSIEVDRVITAQEFAQAQAEAGRLPADFKWEEIKVFTDGLPDVPKFETDLLPKPFELWAIDAAHRMEKAAIEYVAVGIMVVAASLVGRKVQVMPKQFDDWCLVPNFWGVVVGDPASMKTPCLDVAMRQLTKYQDAADIDWEELLKDYGVQERIAKAMRGDADKALAAATKKKACEAVLRDMIKKSEDEFEDPVEPPRKRYIANDSSIEQLGIILAGSPNGLLFFRDELTGWIRELDRPERGKERAWWLEAWNGNGTQLVDRVTRESIKHNQLACVLGGIQPAMLSPMINMHRESGGGDGMLERLQLMVYPDISMSGVDQLPNQDYKLDAVAAFDKLAALPDSAIDNPIVLRFCDEGQAIFNEFSNEILARDEKAKPWLNGHFAKYRSLMPSLALVIHVIECDANLLSESSISEDAAIKAANWCDLLAVHAERVYSLGYASDSPGRALLAKLHMLDDVFSKTDIRNKNWIGLKTSASRTKALDGLVERNYLAMRTTGVGRSKKNQYYKNPALRNMD